MFLHLTQLLLLAIPLVVGDKQSKYVQAKEQVLHTTTTGTEKPINTWIGKEQFPCVKVLKDMLGIIERQGRKSQA